LLHCGFYVVKLRTAREIMEEEELKQEAEEMDYDDDHDLFEEALTSRMASRNHRRSGSSSLQKGARTAITIRIHSLPTSTDADAAMGENNGAEDDDANHLETLHSEAGAGVDPCVESYFDDDLDSDEEEAEMERALSFYQDAHEDQDPAYQAYERSLRIQALQKKLAEIDEADAKSRNEIDDFIRQQLEEKHRSTSVSLEKYKLRVDAEQNRSLQRLQQVFEQKVQSNQQRIQKGVQVLRERHAKEVQALQQRLQQQGQQASFPQAQAQLTAKSQRQLTEFGAKGEEVKKKTEADYKAEIEKIRNNHGARLMDLSANRKKIIEKLTASFQQVRQRYLKRHLQRVMKRKERILAVIQELIAANNASSGGSGAAEGSDAANRQAHPASAMSSSLMSPSRSPLRASTTETASALAVGSPDGAATVSDPADPSESAEDDKAEFRQPSPIKSVQPWVLEQFDASEALSDDASAKRSDRLCAGASARHKHRKAISGQVTRQLSVEIHNEGLWVSIQLQDDDASRKLDGKSSSNGDRQSRNTEEEFLVWGTRARSVLESITSGEIPFGYDRTLIDSSDPLGGQIRCVVTDLRTSEETASAQRAHATREFDASQIAELETKCKELLSKVNEAEAAVSKLQEKEREGTAAVENACSDVAKAKRMQDEFMTKFRNYIGPGP
jgi:vacuolar-type H+-ATPase subunit H